MELDKLQIVVSAVNDEDVGDYNILFGVLYDPEKKKIIDNGSNIDPQELKKLVLEVKSVLDKYLDCEVFKR